MIPEMSSFSHKKEKLRVAAYCRVSTKHTEQLESLEIQKSYFETVIRENPNWSLVKTYSDVGSALRTKNRPGYRQMILDGKKGLFNLVLVKALSRFGRNTVETLAQIREWKQMDIGVYAEMENIDTRKVNDSALSIFWLWLRKKAVAKVRISNLGFEHRCAVGRRFSTTLSFLDIQRTQMGC